MITMFGGAAVTSTVEREARPRASKESVGRIMRCRSAVRIHLVARVEFTHPIRTPSATPGGVDPGVGSSAIVSTDPTVSPSDRGSFEENRVIVATEENNRYPTVY